MGMMTLNKELPADLVIRGDESIHSQYYEHKVLQQEGGDLPVRPYIAMEYCVLMRKDILLDGLGGTELKKTRSENIVHLRKVLKKHKNEVRRGHPVLLDMDYSQSLYEEDEELTQMGLPGGKARQKYQVLLGLMPKLVKVDIEQVIDEVNRLSLKEILCFGDIKSVYSDLLKVYRATLDKKPLPAPLVRLINKYLHDKKRSAIVFDFFFSHFDSIVEALQKQGVLSKCPHCEAVFLQNKAVRRYCSEKCRKRAESGRYYGKNKDKLLSKKRFEMRETRAYYKQRRVKRFKAAPEATGGCFKDPLK